MIEMVYDVTRQQEFHLFFSSSKEDDLFTQIIQGHFKNNIRKLTNKENIFLC